MRRAQVVETGAVDAVWGAVTLGGGGEERCSVRVEATAVSVEALTALGLVATERVVPSTQLLNELW